MFPVNTDTLDALASTWVRSPGILVLGFEGSALSEKHRANLPEGAYHHNHHWDHAITAGVAVYTAVTRLPHMRPVFMTSRAPVAESYTRAQIEHLFGLHESKYDLVLKTEDYAGLPDEDYKVRALHMLKIEPRRVVVAFDANPAAVAAYQKLGIVAYLT